MKTKNYLIDNAHKFIAILLLVQPLLDVLSYWLAEFGISSAITLVLRMGVLAVTVLYAYLISDRKRIYWICIGVMAILYFGHIFACWQAAQADSRIAFGISTIVADLSNYIRVIQMPLTVICFITLLRENDRCFEGIQFGMCAALLIICAVMYIAHITGTDPHTYKFGDETNRGILGWFNNTNSQSNNLCVLLPISFIWQLTWKKRKPVLLWCTCIFGIIAMYNFCTRLAYFGIIGITAGIAVVILILKRTDWKISVILLSLAMLFVILIPVSPMTKHLNHHTSVQAQKQEWLKVNYSESAVQQLLDEKHNLDNTENEDSSDKEDEVEGKDPEEEKKEKEEEINQLLEDQLEGIYKRHIPDFVNIFGLRETMEMYNYTDNVNDLTALRPKKLMFAKMLMNDSPVTTSIFGIDINRFTVGENIYDVENDFHGIFYLYGWAGLIVYLAFIAYFLYLVVWAVLKNIKKYFTLEAASFGIALLLCLAHAYNTAGVLRRPNASIFLSALLAGIYYLVKIKTYKNNEEE